MSMYADYISETRGMGTVETPEGFATYLIDGDCCYIEDIYVRPEFRKTGAGTDLANGIRKMAKEYGCKMLTGSVNARIKDPTTSTKVMLAYGFEISRVVNDAIFFKMEI